MFARGKVVKLDFSNKENPLVRSRTMKSCAADADINNIMHKYKKTGILVDPSAVNRNRVPQFGDFSDVPDFGSIVNRIADAKSAFMRLPADVRLKFNNNVAECLDFIADPANVKSAVDLGLLDKDVLPKEEGTAAPVAPTSTPPDSAAS